MRLPIFEAETKAMDCLRFNTGGHRGVFWSEMIRHTVKRNNIIFRFITVIRESSNLSLIIEEHYSYCQWRDQDQHLG